jgi:hypothetical protein
VLAAHRRKVFQEMIERIPFFEIVKEGSQGGFAREPGCL